MQININTTNENIEKFLKYTGYYDPELGDLENLATVLTKWIDGAAEAEGNRS